MRVSIYSLQNTLFDGQAEKLIARTPQGQITVLNHHLPMVIMLVGPTVEVIGGDAEKTSVPIRKGFLEVRPESNVVILAESQENPMSTNSSDRKDLLTRETR